MSRLMRTSEVAQRPVVTFAGEDVAQIRDIIYGAGGGAVIGFSLAGRGLFAGPMDRALPWSAVSALGSEAVMITDEKVLRPLEEVLNSGAASQRGTEQKSAGRAASGGDVMGSQVLTDQGTDLGKVVDVIIEVGSGSGSIAPCDVVGYEIEASEALGTKGTKLLIPLPDTIAASGEHLMVPTSAKNFVRHDLAGFGAAVTEFRDQLGGQQ